MKIRTINSRIGNTLPKTFIRPFSKSIIISYRHFLVKFQKKTISYNTQSCLPFRHGNIEKFFKDISNVLLKVD